jgi:hypothetical protein
VTLQGLPKKTKQNKILTSKFLNKILTSKFLDKILTSKFLVIYCVFSNPPIKTVPPINQTVVPMQEEQPASQPAPAVVVRWVVCD